MTFSTDPRKLEGKTVETIEPNLSRHYFTVTFSDGTYAAIRKDGIMIYPAAPRQRSRRKE